jgi:branched-chain amino acid aminotransferase
MTPTEKIWHNGKFIAWDEARIHVLSHVVSYGSSVFEGVRCYETATGSAIFRLRDHTRRLLDSAKIYRIEVPFTLEELEQAQLELVRINGLRSCYIRPIVMRGYGTVGVLGTANPVETYLACWEWGQYLGAEALAAGVDVSVSSWHRIAPNTLPALAKAGANYMNSQLIRMQAQVDGYAESIALDHSGHISEGSGENIFVIRDGRILTPPIGSSALLGITRDSILTLARELGIEVLETPIPREMLYIADEIFFSGTAAEVTPIRSVDHIQIGSGRRGPVTERLQNAFFDIVTGRVADRHGWLSYINAPVSAS